MSSTAMNKTLSFLAGASAANRRPRGKELKRSADSNIRRFENRMRAPSGCEKAWISEPRTGGDAMVWREYNQRKRSRTGAEAFERRCCLQHRSVRVARRHLPKS